MEKKYPPPFSLRLTAEERAKLDASAGDMPLGAYIRSRLLDTSSPHRRKMRRPDVDRSLLKKLMLELGRQRFSSNLNRIMKAIETGDLETDDKLEMQLRSLRSDLQQLRRHIRKAMGDNLPKGKWGGRR
jgi:hypothetical protein